jgi:hypothetical protein
VCCALFEHGLLFCVMCVICVLCLIVVPLPPGKHPFAVIIKIVLTLNIKFYKQNLAEGWICQKSSTKELYKEQHYAVYWLGS